MEVFAIIDGINAKKTAMNMTNQQIADASGVPKSTVDRVLRKDTENPTMKVILEIASAVGYDFNTRSIPESADGSLDGPYIRHIISMYETRIAAQERQYNLTTAEKNRWIKMLASIVGILVAGILFILIFDITHPEVGWFQRDTMYHYSSAHDMFIAVRDWLCSL